MKAIKLLAVLIMGSVLVAACSSNGGKTNKNAASEIDEVSVTQIIEDIEIPTDGDGDGDHGQSAGQATYQESPDGLAITVAYNAPTGEGEVVEATFYVSQSEQTDTLLEQIKYYFIYDTPANAEIAYNNNTDGLTRDEIREKQYEVRGNTFSYIEPESAGMPKNQMVIILKGIYARLQQGIIL